jgi:hypothetical protein
MYRGLSTYRGDGNLNHPGNQLPQEATIYFWIWRGNTRQPTPTTIKINKTKTAPIINSALISNRPSVVHANACLRKHRSPAASRRLQ